MVFSTPLFLFYFLTIVLMVYYLVPLRFRNGVLMLASLFFYYWGEQSYTVIMLPASLPPTPPPMACQKMANGFATTEELAGKAGVLVSHEGRRPSPCVLMHAARWQSGCGVLPAHQFG